MMTAVEKHPPEGHLRVAVLGYGAIGASVSDALAEGAVVGAHLTGVVTREGRTTPHDDLTLARAIEVSDIIVECAGTEAAATLGPQVIAAGTDLLLVSIGALADDEARRSLIEAGPGRMFLSTGAIGGLDVLAAAARGDGLTTVNLTTTKRANTLLQPWMSDSEADALRATNTPVTVFSGNVREAIRLFPKSLNVAVALAVATNMWGQTTVTMIADPHADLTRHEISAHGPSGHYEFTVSNLPHEVNPSTSKIVPAAVLAGLARLARPSGSFV